MKRALVTGGAGFIGSHVVGRLTQMGVDVLVIDDLSTGSLLNIPTGIKVIRASVTDLDAVKEVMEGVDSVFHLAAVASVPRSVADPITANGINIGGTLNILTAARDEHVGKVVFFSSSSVYGDSARAAQTEEDGLRPCSPYAVTKIAGEHYCRLFTQLYGLPTVSLRLFNVYGERQVLTEDSPMVIPAFIHAAAHNTPLTITGDGVQSRDFVYVEDVVDASIRAAETVMTGEFNVGTGKPVSILALAEMIVKMTRSGSVIKTGAARPGDPLATCADMKKFKEFGFAPKWTLERGLKRLLNGTTA